MTALSDGRVRVHFKAPWRRGIAHADMDADKFLARLCALAPRRIGWASLLARVFAVDVTVCRKFFDERYAELASDLSVELEKAEFGEAVDERAPGSRVLTVKRNLVRKHEGPPKGKRERKVPLSSRLDAALRALHPRAEYPRVFTLPDGRDVASSVLRHWFAWIEAPSAAPSPRRSKMSRNPSCHRTPPLPPAARGRGTLAR